MTCHTRAKANVTPNTIQVRLSTEPSASSAIALAKETTRKSQAQFFVIDRQCVSMILCGYYKTADNGAPSCMRKPGALAGLGKAAG